MAKSVHDDVLDGAFNVLKNNATRLTVCEGEPTTFAQANTNKPTGKRLANVTINSGHFTHADGDTSGRKTIVAAQTGLTVDVTGTADHIALLDVANSKLLYVTTATSQVLTAGNTLNVGAWDIEIADPS